MNVRLKGPPVWCLSARDPGNLVVKFRVLKVKVRDLGFGLKACGLSVPRAGDAPPSSGSPAERKLSPSPHTGTQQVE